MTDDIIKFQTKDRRLVERLNDHDDFGLDIYFKPEGGLWVEFEPSVQERLALFAMMLEARL